MIRRKSRQRLLLADRVLDILMHPLLLTTYAIAYNCFVMIPGEEMWRMKCSLVLGFFLMTALFPGLIGILMKRSHAVSSFWHARCKKDRRALLLCDLIFYTSTLSLDNRAHMPMPLKLIPLTAIILILALLLINLRWESIDSHFAALGALISHTLFLGMGPVINVTPALIMLLVMIGLKAAIQVERHNIGAVQLLLSLLTGFTITTFTMFMFLK